MKDLILYQETYKQFHLRNDFISYIFMISHDGKLLHLYYGPTLPEGDYRHLVEMKHRPMTTYRQEGDLLYSLEHLQQEFPEYGATDFRHPALELSFENGSRLTDFIYKDHVILKGKPKLEGLPATYVENEDECQTLQVNLIDSVSGVEVSIQYSIFRDFPVITRSHLINNQGSRPLSIEGVTSLSLDLPDRNYEMIQLSGAWARERHIHSTLLRQGIQSIESTRGISSHLHNPFLALKRPETTENQGEVIGLSLIYSGNFLLQAEVDTFDVTRLQVGINPFQFCWKLDPGASFTSPEAVLVYSRNGLNDMSQTFHRLYRTRLARGEWRDKERPILLNNWEATYFDFDQEKLLRIAQNAKEVGVELFVLDDGWFGKRTNDRTGLGDWVANRERFPDTIGALSEKIHDMGLKFGLWFEPEMVNKDSDLYRKHPDWILEVTGHSPRHGRNQFVLDFSREEVVDAIYEQMARVIEETKLDYIKWDMNRPLTDVFSKSLAPDQQGEVFHRYVLGLYHLYDRLTTAFPSILFESCASGGGRFDPGLLYYAPQTWTSDDTDAVERLKIQYGTSLVYPLSTMGAHVSIVPNHQTNRITPLTTRGNVAYFGVFGYELDLADLTQAEKEIVKEQIDFYKKERSLIHQGNFYRLRSPFDTNQVVWSVVSQNRSRVILAQYKLLNEVNRSYDRVYLQGLKADALYEVDGKQYSGAELMLAGFSLSDASCGQPLDQEKLSCDFDSHIWVFEEVK